MNQQERNALREKHRPYAIGDSGGYYQCCEGCRNDDTGFEPDGPFYPCDVIKVLDAWEATL